MPKNRTISALSLVQPPPVISMNETESIFERSVHEAPPCAQGFRGGDHSGSVALYRPAGGDFYILSGEVGGI